MLVATANDDFLPFGIKVEGGRVLKLTLDNPGIRIGEVSAVARIEPSTLTHLVKRLEASGLITRGRVAGDDRSVSLDLTAKGKRVAKEIYRLSFEHTYRLTEGIPKAEVARFRATLQKMEANLLGETQADVTPSIAAFVPRPRAKRAQRAR